MNFADRLHAAIRAKGTPALVGLDPHLDLLPDEFAVAREPSASRKRRAEALSSFCCELVDVIADRVPAVKPQSAFFEQLGADGVAAWERVVSHARGAGLLVIGDVKRGDISSTAEAYARAFLSGVPGCDRECLCDAVTLNAFLGEDSVRPFLEACAESGGGLYVLVRTSNRGSRDFQRHGDPELSFAIAAAVERWGAELVGECGWSSVGAVVGATHGDELRAFRAALPRTPLLLPGYGAQGAGADDVVGAFRSADGTRVAPTGALVNSSRGIAFAYRTDARHADDWRAAARAALEAMVDDLARAIGREA
ncbi:MAG TPA: orotidine-5'-phosphate decarboxylase [Planctomycetota bacterium]|nr:orotidine-5'-phosphate decarboxylase [Planctomycetota bacterium]